MTARAQNVVLSRRPDGRLLVSLLFENHVTSATYYAAGTGMLLLALDLVFENDFLKSPSPLRRNPPGLSARGRSPSPWGWMSSGDVAAGPAVLLSLSLTVFFAATLDPSSRSHGWAISSSRWSVSARTFGLAVLRPHSLALAFGHPRIGLLLIGKPGRRG